MDIIQKAWQIQDKIEARLKNVSDKTLIVVSSYSVAIIFILYASKICFNSLDINIFYFGAMGFMIVPMLGYMIYTRKGVVSDR